MRELELRQKGATNGNWKFFYAGAIGFLMVVVLAFFITQYVVKDDGVYRGQEYPVGETRAPMDTQSAPPQAPGASQGERGADGAFRFAVPAHGQEPTVYFT